MQSSLAYDQEEVLTNGHSPQHLNFDLGITDSVINATGPAAGARLREVIANLTRHLHDFCRESRITRAEFHAALTMVSEIDMIACSVLTPGAAKSSRSNDQQ